MELLEPEAPTDIGDNVVDDVVSANGVTRAAKMVGCTLLWSVSAGFASLTYSARSQK